MGDRLCARCRATWINAEFCWRCALEEIDGLRALTEDQFSVLAAARERIAELERVANVRLVALDRIVADLDRARAVVEAARRVDPECGRYAGVDCADHAEPPEVCAPCALRLAVRTHDRGES